MEFRVWKSICCDEPWHNSMNAPLCEKKADQTNPARQPAEGWSLAEAVQSSVAIRLVEVRRCIDELLGEPTDPVDTIHRLRVACRRAVTCFSFFRTVIDKPTRRRFARRLRKLRRKAGDVRDLDVLSERIRARKSRGAMKLIDRFQKTRESLEPEIRRYARKVVVELPSTVAGQSPFPLRETCADILDKPFRPWGVGISVGAARMFLKSLRKADGSVNSLHRARIDGKKLRYSLEILEPVIPEVATSPATRRLRKFQALVGNIHDHLVQRKALREQADAIGEKSVHRLVREESRRGKRSMRQYLKRFEKIRSAGEIEAFSRDLADLLRPDAGQTKLFPISPGD
jgi:CHAD domain-containing protein